MVKKRQVEIFCAACECRLLTEAESFGPVCKDCYRKTRRKDSFTKTTGQRRFVALIPTLCPHEEGCKYDRMPPRYFNILVFNEDLEPIKVEGPYSTWIAEKEVQRLRNKINKQGKRGK